MKFQLVDTILERSPDRIVAMKQVSLAEEYLADHFPGFPILPGVLMVEAMVQAASIMLADRTKERLVLGAVSTFKYGSMVHPGETLEVEVTLAKTAEDGSFQCRGIGRVRRPARTGTEGQDGETAAAGGFTMRPLRES